MALLIVIAEGADLSLLDSLAAHGRAPWWQGARRRGNLWRMSCGPAPYEPSNLASALTGVGRGEHGCYSFWSIRPREPRGRPEVLTSDSVRAPWLWEWKELRDLRACVLNVPLTHPPRPLHGVLLSYPMEATLRYSFPPGVVHDLRKRGLRYAHDVSVFYRGEPAATFFARVVQVAIAQLETALALVPSFDLVIVNLTIVDRLSHFLWREYAERPPNDPAAHLTRGYQFLDEALARLEQAAGNGPVLLFSEIGFGPIDGFMDLDASLAKVGLLRWEDSGEVDETRSVAREAVQGSHGIVLLGKAAGDRAAAEEVRAALLAARDEQGRPLVRRAWLREELYEGPYLELAPEIVHEPADPRRPPLGDPRWARHVHRHLQTGWHRDEGFLLSLGARPIASADTWIRPEAIAPTIGALLRRDPPRHCRWAPVAAAE